MSKCVHFDVFEDGTVCCCRGGRCVDVVQGMCESCKDKEAPARVRRLLRRRRRTK